MCWGFDTFLDSAGPLPAAGQVLGCIKHSWANTDPATGVKYIEWPTITGHPDTFALKAASETHMGFRIVKTLAINLLTSKESY
ncbi:hypothetical protein E2C01_023004 [Portunus trituberculatus]|uniref:Uncharacterized protein n=1 Tax=Portunus trituberculatus TaxID=210409 RepID=A0A5B7E8T4_PORTR|nr:hypothetical protein [Portunus trituberculatus]